MSNLSLRGLESGTLAALKTRAQQENASVNTLVLRLIDQGLGMKPAKPLRTRYDDLDALAGSWDSAEADAFFDAVAPFNEVDGDLWK